MLIAGKREVESGSISVRRHGEGDLGSKSVSEVVDMFKKEVAGKGLAQDSV